jgi:hypothetical protein
MILNCHTDFQPLEEVWLGDTYPVSFYDNLNQELQEHFCKLTEDTQNTLNKVEDILKQHNVIVRRPSFDSDSSNYRDKNDMLIKPPMSVRDFNMCLGNTMYNLNLGWKINPFKNTIEQYLKNNQHIHMVDRSKPYAWVGYGEVVRLGKDLYYDVALERSDAERLQTCINGFKDIGKDYRRHLLHFGGHADGVFCPVKEGYIISTHYGDAEIYQQTFPGWEVFWLPDVTQKRMQKIKKSKVSLNFSKWWIPDNFYHSPVFNEYILDAVKHWTGDSTETVFDVNMLVIDEKNVICFCEDDAIFDIFKKLNLNAYIVDHPSRGFWDAGFHCLTADIRRTGGKVDYFPERESNFEREYK